MSKPRTIKRKKPARYVKVLHWSDGDGLLHRVGGPAIVTKGGIKQWYMHGKLHREDGPAVVSRRGDFEAWYNHSLLHRIDGPAYTSNEIKKWYRQGVRHRIGGPAIEWANGDYRYYEEGMMHRLDGPAQCYNGGFAWFVKGHEFTEDEFYRFVDTLTGEILTPPGYQYQKKTSPLVALLDLVESVSAQCTVGCSPRISQHMDEDEVDWNSLSMT